MRWLSKQVERTLRIAVTAAIAFATPALADDNPFALKPLPAETLAAMEAKDVPRGAPVYLRVFKQESELEFWQQRRDGRYAHIKTFPICKWSGGLGPKQTQGDYMSPEGFYALTATSLRPDSQYHLAMDIGYPNGLDAALGRTGNFIMIHGRCKSVGCFAMTDHLIEEIFAMTREAFENGSVQVPVHIFPFRMTAENVAREKTHAAAQSWQPLRQAYDDFAASFHPPTIGTCSKRYVVNPLAPVGDDPAADCPKYLGKLLSPVPPSQGVNLLLANEPIVAVGEKNAPTEPGSASILAVRKAPSRKALASGDSDLGAMRPLITPR